MAYSVLLVITGLILLTFGAEGLVRAGASLALRFGVSPLVIGLTILAFGTGSPELVVSTQAALYGNSAIALGNIIGSNISNTCLILGAAAVIYPMEAKTQVVRREVPVMVVATGLLWLLIADGELGRIDGAIFVAASFTYTLMVYLIARKNKSDEIHQTFSEAIDEPSRSKMLDLLTLLGGLAFLIIGAKMLLEGAVEIARIYNISEVVIGLTVIAIGTSLPELATSTVASLKKNSDLALGNAIGSNILNVTCILGVAALIQPIPTNDVRNIDMFVVLGVSILLWAMLGTRFQLDRIEGLLLLSIYFIYIYSLIPI
ncbi:MAG: calcium/sodium antiporter [Pyrinomonadaceae bacterium]|nr:calcium/sodium antiporter [Pyrinomonadaceae bacterium]